MDTSLKQRLIGAIILVALAVIFLPMLVKGPVPKSGVETVSLDVPQPPAGTGQPTQELPLVMPQQAEEATHSPVSSPSAPSTVTQIQGPSSTLAAENQNEPGGLKPSLAAGDFVVRIGAFSNAEQAQLFASRLHQNHLPAESEQFNDRQGPAWRVRIGPYSDQAQAQIARVQAVAMTPGKVAEVVVLDSRDDHVTNPAPESSQTALSEPTDTASATRHHDKPHPVAVHAQARPHTPAPATAGTELNQVGFAIQVGAYSRREDANALKDRLRMAGFSAFVEFVQTPKGPLNRVRVGPVADRATADSLKTQIAAKLGVEGMVRQYP